mgnify:CR=1 FL=1
MIFQIDNKNIHASDAGQGVDPKKDTIIFLHGSGLSHIVWSLTEQFFSNKNFNVLSIDLPGHGQSDGPCLESIEKISDWLEEVPGVKRIVISATASFNTFGVFETLIFFSLADCV